MMVPAWASEMRERGSGGRERMNTVGKMVPSLGRGIDGFSAWLRKGFSHGQLGVVHLSI